MSLLAVGAALALSPLVVPGHPSVRPWPIGPGAAYRPPAATATVEAGAALGRFRCAPPGAAFPLHLEIFADRRVVVVPAGIGVGRPAAAGVRSVSSRSCTYPLSTRTPGGIVEVADGLRLTLRDLFRIWGQALGARRIASFSSGAPVRAYLNGRRVRGAPGAIPLTRHAEIVLELGAYVPPHPSFLFAGGDS